LAHINPDDSTLTTCRAPDRGRFTRKQLLYVLTVDWFFLSHFSDRAIAAADAGFRVSVACRRSGVALELPKARTKWVDWNVTRKGLSPRREVAAIRELVAIYKREQPDIVHHVALKPIIYGTLAARIAGVPRIINAPVGMGFVFTSKGVLARVMRPLVQLLLAGSLAPRGSRVIFENRDDLQTAVSKGLVPTSAAVLIRGAGVDLERFVPSPEPTGSVRVMLIGRMLKDKGVYEFVAAARKLRAEGVDAEWILVGAPDDENRASIDTDRLRRWDNEGVIRWLGARGDMPKLLKSAHIVALPSYREGLPKSLLEAMAAGRPIVTTDVPGCREVCAHGVNGLLVPPRDEDALAEALRELIEDPERRIRFGAAGRKRAESEFSTRLVQEKTLAVYREVLEGSLGRS
jgi:glycosyltransferase involved in cell wall biosynthesis